MPTTSLTARTTVDTQSGKVINANGVQPCGQVPFTMPDQCFGDWTFFSQLIPLRSIGSNSADLSSAVAPTVMGSNVHFSMLVEYLPGTCPRSRPLDVAAKYVAVDH